MNLIPRLRIICETFCATSGLSVEQVSYRVCGDPRRLPLVFSGARGMTVRSYEQALAWLSANWPEAVAWPAGIERPNVAHKEDAA